MGWARGSNLFEVILETVVKEVPDKETRKKIYEPILEAFQDADWDSEDEVEGIDPAFDELYGFL